MSIEVNATESEEKKNLDEQISTTNVADNAPCPHKNGDNPALFEEVRSRLMLGNLPDDFLRLPKHVTPTISVSSSSQDSRIRQEQPMFAGSQYPGVLYATCIPSANYVGRFHLTLVEAKLVKNYGLTKMNPYVRCRVGQNVFETTAAAGGGRSPKWNKSILCFLPKGITGISLEIYDECLFSSDYMIASAHVTIPPAVFAGDTIDKWYPLSGKQGDDKEGEINMVMSLISMKNLRPVADMSPENNVIQDSITQTYVCSTEEIVQLKELFPWLDEELIKSVLTNFNGNTDAALTSLLEMCSEPTPAPESSETKAPADVNAS